MFGTLEHGYIVVAEDRWLSKRKGRPSSQGCAAMATPAGLAGERGFTSVTRLARR